MTANGNNRIVSAGFHMSLDGYIARRSGELDWIRFSSDIFEHASETMGSIDTMLMGRVTYAQQAASWPGQTGQLAAVVNAHDKVVFTRTPDEIDTTIWNRSRAASNPGEEISTLREMPGKTIGVSGGARLLDSMFEAQLIDEVRVITHPVTLGAGLSPWPAGLRLTKHDQTRTFKSGAILHTYTPDYGYLPLP